MTQRNYLSLGLLEITNTDTPRWSTQGTSVFMDISRSLKARALRKIIGISYERFSNLWSTLESLGTSSENLKKFCEILAEWWGHLWEWSISLFTKSTKKSVIYFRGCLVQLATKNLYLDWGSIIIHHWMGKTFRLWKWKMQKLMVPY